MGYYNCQAPTRFQRRRTAALNLLLAGVAAWLVGCAGSKPLQDIPVLDHHAPPAPAPIVDPLAMTPDMLQFLDRLTESLAGEVAKLRDEPTELISFGREVRAEAGARWQDGEFRIALLGFLDYYPDGLALMAEAWPRITKAVPHSKLVYIGKKDQLPFLPPVLREALEFHEFPSNDERDDILASCQLAFLPGPLRSTTSLGRFSVPCRIADYLHLGLPILGSVGAGGATAQFLQSIEGRAFYRAEDALTLASHVTLIAERGAWEKASATSRQFAQERLNMNTIRPRLMEIIENVRSVA